MQIAPSSLNLNPNSSLQLACPVLRCLSNLLTEAAAEAVGGQLQLRDERVVAALFILLQFLLQKQPSLLPEGLWLLNNLTGKHHNLPRPGPLDTGNNSSWPGLTRVGLGVGWFHAPVGGTSP